MEKIKQQDYENVDELRKIIKSLKGRKFHLDCGHRITLCHSLGNDITIRHGKEPFIICSLCGNSSLTQVATSTTFIVRFVTINSPWGGEIPFFYILRCRVIPHFP